MTSNDLFASTPPDVLMAMVEDSRAAASQHSTPKSKSKNRGVRYAKLDGKPLRRASGKHSKKKSDTDDEASPRPVRTVPVNQRLGFRPAEFARLIGVSDVTVWRGIRDGKINVIDQRGIKIIPRAFAIRAGFITADDSI
jgi:DNA invertase Pin-like site-specific DNA recombinase